MGDILSLMGILFSIFVVCWVATEMLASVLPAGLVTFLRRSLNLTLNIMDWVGEGVWNLLATLWRGRPKQAQVSTVSQARPAALMSRSLDAAPDQRADRGLSGLSADFEAPEEPDAAQAYIESLDIGSRRRAVALLVADGWGTGKIRQALVGDNGEIGREAAEARAKMGLVDEEPTSRTPLAGRELADGVEFRRQPAP